MQLKMLLKLFPSFMGEILTHIPQAAFELVPWREIKNAGGKLLSQWWEKNSNKELEDFLTKILSSYQGDSPTLKTKYQSFQWQGEKILEFYFLQLANPKGFYLDLRLSNFQFNEDKFHYQTHPLWYCFDNTFRHNLIKMYHCYFKGDDNGFDEQLAYLKLSHQLNERERLELRELFYHHFKGGKKSLTPTLSKDQDEASESDPNGLSLTLESFKESFVLIFRFFLEKKINLSVDFLFLGIYLVTLYLSLEELNEKSSEPLYYDLDKIFFKTFDYIEELSLKE